MYLFTLLTSRYQRPSIFLKGGLWSVLHWFGTCRFKPKYRPKLAVSINMYVERLIKFLWLIRLSSHSVTPLSPNKYALKTPSMSSMTFVMFLTELFFECFLESWTQPIVLLQLLFWRFQMLTCSCCEVICCKRRSVTLWRNIYSCF